MLDYLITIAGQIGHWGYLVIFIIVALECQVVLGLVMLVGVSRVYLGAHYLSDVLGN